MADYSPKLLCIAGPLLGETIPLPEGIVVFGRDGSCDFVRPDTAVSRPHTAIDPEPEELVTVEDLDGRKGTFVNEGPVRKSVLASCDTFRLGESVFFFQPGHAIVPMEPKSERTIIQTSGMRWLSRADRETEEVRGRTARELEALLALSTALQGERGLEAVARRLLLVLQTALRVPKFAILLYFDGIEAPPWTLALDGDPPPFETGLLTEVIGREKSAAWDQVLVSPVVGSGKPFGVIWAEGAVFDAAHLRLAVVAGAIAGLALQAARSSDEAEAENRRLRSQLEGRHDMVGSSEPMQAIYRFIARVAPTPSTVLVLGESGTGKKLVAQAIHRNSPRAAKPFFAINCASLSENLLERELFGHENGAFTGAVAQKRGKLEVVNGGSVFLDELGEMPLNTQAKLLRVLQQREMERLGGTRLVPLDIRVIAATNVALLQAVKDRRFREDLYCRLNVVSVEMPPLRKRLADVPLLATYFVARFAAQLGRRMNGISPEARSLLLRYDWPGNVRELQDTVERAVVTGLSEQVLPEDLPESLLERTAPAEAAVGYHSALNEKKKQLILEALATAGGSVTGAAERLGLHPNYLHRLMSNLELR